MHNAGTQSAPAETTTAALAPGGRQPAWMTLDEARQRSFTGEIIFEVEPEVLAYLDSGVVYFAERATDAPLGLRLVDAGVLDAEQLERGTVRIGDLEHLGRLFDREPSVDRDAVMVVTETSTEGLIADLANSAVATIRATAYRHHPSGVRRWFVGADAVPPRMEIEPTASPARLAAFAEAESLTIEWDRFDDDSMGTELTDFESVEFVMFDPFRDVAVDSGRDVAVDEADADEADLDEAASIADDDLSDFEFEWPDGTHEPLKLDEPDAPGEAVFVETADGELRFEMPPLALADDDSSADQVPDDVAAAVRRAIAAIEAAAVSPIAESVDIDTHAELSVADSPTIAERAIAGGQDADTDVASVTSPVPVQPAPISGFAPPTLDMSAAAVYARMEAELDVDAVAEVDADVVASGLPVAAHADDLAVAPVSPALPDGSADAMVAVSSDVGGAGDDRASALRRLIGGLRRKDR